MVGEGNVIKQVKLHLTDQPPTPLSPCTMGFQLNIVRQIASRKGRRKRHPSYWVAINSLG
jgi:hypothetical protein